VIPELYWMLECKGCGRRRVVFDSFQAFIGTNDPDVELEEGEGYGGAFLPDRVTCVNACPQGMRAIGSMNRPEDSVLDLYEPYGVSVELDESQREEWRRLIQEAGLDG